MAKHRPKWHRIKANRNYTVDEAARELGVAKGTLRRWQKGGELPCLDDRKPALFLGSIIKAFGLSRSKLKIKCQPHQFYCFKCRKPKHAAGNIADFVQRSPKSGNLKAICECGTIMNKNVSVATMLELQAVLDITIHQAPGHLVEKT